MLSYKLFTNGMPDLLVQAIGQDVATGISAAGTTKDDATELTSAVNVVETVASGAGVILYSLSVPVDSQGIFNSGANELLVYPVSGATINNLPTNQAMILPIDTVVELIMVSSTQHIANLSQ